MCVHVFFFWSSWANMGEPRQEPGGPDKELEKPKHESRQGAGETQTKDQLNNI